MGIEHPRADREQQVAALEARMVRIEEAMVGVVAALHRLVDGAIEVATTMEAKR